MYFLFSVYKSDNEIFSLLIETIVYAIVATSIITSVTTGI